jgi:peptidoglycan/LPS O-acetylase OafA/YrhL
MQDGRLPGSEGKGQLLELTSTRFFAAMAVLLGHFGDFLKLPSWFSWMVGGFGVSFFFVLSGFILCYRYWDDFAPGVQPRAYRRYFVARVARVYPSYAMALVLITLLYMAMNALHPGAITYPGNTVTSWFVNLFALQTFALSYPTQQNWNGPGWSISTEFGFYVACPLILAALARYGTSRRALLGWLAATVAFGAFMQALALVLVFKYGWSREFWLDLVASRNIFWRIPEFLVGVVVARFHYGGHLGWLARPSARNGLLVASLAGVAALNLAPWPAEHTAHLVMRQFRLDVAYMIPFAGIILALAAGPTFVSPLLRRPSWVFLGDISYGIYIYHWIPWTVVAHGLAAGLWFPPWIVTIIVALTILFSAASYLWYERPARLFIRRKFAQRGPVS